MAIGVGQELGAVRIVEMAREPKRSGQLVAFFAGEGKFTSDLLGDLAQNCPSAPEAVVQWQNIWLTRDEPNPETYDEMHALDIVMGTRGIIKKLAECKGSCSDCAFDRGFISIEAANRLDLMLRSSK